MKLLLALLGFVAARAIAAEPLTLARDGHWLIVRGGLLPGEIRVNYLEAYCRSGSTKADWVKHTIIPHRSETISSTSDKVVLKDTLQDGVIVEHEITASADEITFRLTAKNPTSQPSDVQWAQPCVRLSAFLGTDEKTASNTEDFLPRCFVFLGGKLTRLPTQPWATEARYVPGQVWVPKGVSPEDVNPRPQSTLKPTNGLIGCFSADEKVIWATAWEPYQELFQGVARCLHSDLRIGGLAPGAEKAIRGKMYIVPNDVPALLTRYQRDFPEHAP